MKPEKPPTFNDPAREVTVLIETLHQSGQRLEDLTAGEVDAVTDSGGRTMLLRRSQDILRDNEAARQTAILNSLPAHIALIDVFGRIISVNAAWTRFPCAGVPYGAWHETGRNYLDICDNAEDEYATEAHRLAQGIRSVLAGGVDSFSLEYSCRSATDQYWFQLTITPLGSDPPTGAVVMHLDITERKRGDEEMRRFATAMDSVSDAVYLIDRESMRFIYANEAACRLLNLKREILMSLQVWEAVPIPRAELERSYDALIASGGTAEPLETLQSLADGTQLWVDIRRHAHLAGGRWMIVTLVRDITANKLADDAILREKNFIEAMLANLPGLFYVMDNQGRFLRWNRNFEVVSGDSPEEVSRGTPERYFLGADREAVVETIGRVFATGHASVEAEFVTKDHGKKLFFFTGNLAQIENKPCLIGMGVDISARKQAEQALRESERRFSDILGNVELISLMLDCDARITYCNDYFLKLTGWRHEEVIGRGWFELFVPPESQVRMGAVFQELLANAPASMHNENQILTRAGEHRLIRWNNTVLRSGAGEVIGSASIGEDITDRKAAEARIVYLSRVHAVLSGINALIVRVSDRGELFTEACRIAVDTGGFRMAMIGLVDPGTMLVAPVASSGFDDKLMSAVKEFLASAETSSTALFARAVANKTAMVSNASLTDPNVPLATLYAAYGARSLAVLPLIVGGEALGILALYASEPQFFHAEEMKLLTELAGDISFALDHIDKQEQLDYLAYYDALTGLANRRLFLDRLAQGMRSAAKAGHKLAVLLLDLERFKNINDSLGQPAGDALLKQVADWLTRDMKDANLLARVDADHFAVMLPEVKQASEVAQLIEKSREAFLNHSFTLNGAVFRVAAKIGVALFPDDASDADSLFKNAEAALKKAKASGERYLFYTQKMTEMVAGKLNLENHLRQALDHEEFVLHYQPKVDLDTGNVSGAEALIRWNDPQTGLVPPGRFIPILEEIGLVYEVGRWALVKALEDYLRWRDAGLPAVRVAVNVSPLQLRNRDFVAEIGHIIAIDPRAAAGLELEITESLIMEDVAHTIASLTAIRAMGIRIAIDDFGTGFSSLAYLSQLPVDVLKIDRSFVIGMTESPEGLALVSTIINMAHALKLKVVAEGVESDEQSRLLRLLKCDVMQGYLFSKPVPADIFEARFLLHGDAQRAGA
jgi:diguanylate cyclase (GGDEF)-like protein/PAS domain S-box-containing protein